MRAWVDRATTIAIYAALAAILAVELGMAYTLGKTDAEIACTERMVAKTQEYIDLWMASQPAVAHPKEIPVPVPTQKVEVQASPREAAVVEPEDSADPWTAAKMILCAEG